jgi:hypothetical protein
MFHTLLVKVPNDGMNRNMELECEQSPPLTIMNPVSILTEV